MRAGRPFGVAFVSDRPFNVRCADGRLGELRHGSQATQRFKLRRRAGTDCLKRRSRPDEESTAMRPIMGDRMANCPCF
jgi:hypothetical protein